MRLFVFLLSCFLFLNLNSGVAQTVSERVKNTPKSLNRKVKTNPQNQLPELVDYLTKDVSSPKEKVKNIHDWICEHVSYDADALYGRRKTQVETYAVLKTQRSVCEGYANLFQSMCEIADIESVKIRGYARGYGSDVFKDISKAYRANHAWNVVRINNEWLLVDCTWDASYLHNGKSVKKYSTAYLFPDPKEMFFTHYPENQKWQLLSPTKTYSDYKKQVQIFPLFLSSGIQLNENISAIETTDGEFSFKLKVPENIDVIADIQKTNGSILQNQTLVSKDNNFTKITARFPSKTKYKLFVYVKDKEKESKQYEGILAIGIENRKANKLAFPEFYQEFVFANGILLSPTLSPLQKGKEYTFQWQMNSNSEQGIFVNKKIHPATKEGDRYSIKMKATGKEMFIYQKKGNEYQFLLKFKVSSL